MAIFDVGALFKFNVREQIIYIKGVGVLIFIYISYKLLSFAQIYN